MEAVLAGRSSDDMDSAVAGRGLRLAAILTTPLLLMAPLAWFNVFNPMARTFADAFEVANETDESIEVTPIGYAFNTRGRTPLPLLSTGRLALPVWRSVRSIPPRSAVTITYDGDDHGASDLLIQGRRGGPRWLALAEYPTGSPLEQPTSTRWVIKSVSELPAAPADLLDVGRAAGRRGYWLFGAHFGFLAPLGLWLTSRRAERASKRAS